MFGLTGAVTRNFLYGSDSAELRDRESRTANLVVIASGDYAESILFSRYLERLDDNFASVQVLAPMLLKRWLQNRNPNVLIRDDHLTPETDGVRVLLGKALQSA